MRDLISDVNYFFVSRVCTTHSIMKMMQALPLASFRFIEL